MAKLVIKCVAGTEAGVAVGIGSVVGGLFEFGSGLPMSYERTSGVTAFSWLAFADFTASNFIGASFSVNEAFAVGSPPPFTSITIDDGVTPTVYPASSFADGVDSAGDVQYRVTADQYGFVDSAEYTITIEMTESNFMFCDVGIMQPIMASGR